jgi:hypothetical protein
MGGRDAAVYSGVIYEASCYRLRFEITKDATDVEHCMGGRGRPTAAHSRWAGVGEAQPLIDGALL